MRIGVIGATSLVGQSLLPTLAEETSWEIVAFSRRVQDFSPCTKAPAVDWRLLREVEVLFRPEQEIPYWICLAPIWVLPAYFPMFSSYGMKHMVALSSTSRFTKSSSPDRSEQAVVGRLAQGEQCLIDWAEAKGVTWTILRPTLTYGLGCDQNVSVIARFIRRFAFFPLLGGARGLRQPVHARDVAQACRSALIEPKSWNQSYNLSGGETLTYRQMVERIFSTMGIVPRLATFPLWSFRLVLFFLHWSPRFRHWSVAMAERMNQDLVFDHDRASCDLSFSPRPFLLAPEDLPS